MRNKQKKAKIKEKMISEFRTVSVGDVCNLDDCCRDVKLGSYSAELGSKISGWNTLTDRLEIWEIVRIENQNRLVKRIQ